MIFILETRSADEVNNLSRMIEMSTAKISASCNLAVSASLSALKFPSIGSLPNSVFSICEGIQCIVNLKCVSFLA